ncbi:hypothetical protein ACFFLM_00720 [Deinococcus oregonensis]|uniref:Uncharacterized protein n=1 Tax=Deinococcus oregonensis TaxID=1805970 RepID=A0ABV6ASM5_9DEIO
MRRLITLTGAGVPHPGDQPKAIDHIFRTLLKVMQVDVLRDSVAHADLIWTGRSCAHRCCSTARRRPSPVNLWARPSRV